MRKIDALELKQIQLNIMDTISNFCEQNNIKYWLHFGSLLGAIRHKGYIPWDDDIDIGMLREDYDKFAENFNSYNEQYQLHDLNNDTEYNLLFGKVFDIKTFAKDSNMSKTSCVNVDIFVFDEISDKGNKQKKMFKRRNLYRMMNNQQMLPIRFSKNILKNLLKIIIKFILNFVPRNWFVKRYTKILKRSFEYSNYVGNFLGYTDDVFSKKLVEDTYKVDFEDRQYRIPAGYDEILRICYGNYMELPPVDQRGGGHVGIEVYSIT